MHTYVISQPTYIFLSCFEASISTNPNRSSWHVHDISHAFSERHLLEKCRARQRQAAGDMNKQTKTYYGHFDSKLHFLFWGFISHSPIFCAFVDPKPYDPEALPFTNKFELMGQGISRHRGTIQICTLHWYFCISSIIQVYTIFVGKYVCKPASTLNWYCSILNCYCLM